MMQRQKEFTKNISTRLAKSLNNKREDKQTKNKSITTLITLLKKIRKEINKEKLWAMLSTGTTNSLTHNHQLTKTKDKLSHL